jgi:uncharacterized protein YjbJ (UPF0337 family)
MWHQFKGELKKQWGKFTDDDLRQIDGDMEKFQGIMQQRYADQKENVKKWAEQWFNEHPWKQEEKKAS